MLRTISGTFLSAVLLIIAYPQIEWWPLAWAAFVPLFLAIDGKCYKSAFGWAYLCGFIFFAGTLGWFVYVTYPGAFLLIAYLSLYFALFGAAFKWARPLPLLSRLFIVPSVWVVLEFCRAHLFTGFGWVLLGHSQYKNLFLIQIADLTGVYGVSFVVMLVNVLIFESFKICSLPCTVSGAGRAGEGGIIKAQILVGLILCLVLGYGAWRVVTFSHGPTVNVGVVQPNIPQALKWDERLQPWVAQKTLILTRGFNNIRPDLIVWPETSLPGVTSEVPELVGQIKAAARNMRAPILMGAITDEHNKYYNSAYLISIDGKFAGRYDKIHLV
ncbi:MAG: apolipoprotein N-acyltransferase, partial [Candidatus Omnitrophica bacterium]|nr:apolipoprotein N-acyltransferase [Candidatus Omnitrophota bacterium]